MSRDPKNKKNGSMEIGKKQKKSKKKRALLKWIKKYINRPI